MSGLLRAGGKMGLGGLIAATIGYNSIYTVEPGRRGLIFDHFRGGIQMGVVKKEGAHMLIPFLQYPIFMDVRTTAKSIPMATGTKDLQSVNLSLRVLYRPQEDRLPQIFKNSNYDYAQRILPSITNEVVKAVVAQYNADQLLTQRELISREIRESLYERGSHFGLVLDDVSITDLAFSHDFSRAIEDKQVAEQHAERAKFVVAKREQERQALIIRSKGDAEAARLVSDALEKHGKGLVELRRIETAQEIATTLSRNGNVTYLPNKSNGMLLNIPVMGARR